VGTIVVAVALGLRGVGPLLAFGLGAFAGVAAVRQLVISTRRNGFAGFLGRANGGMVVHLGVVVAAVAIAASSSYAERAELRLAPNESGEVGGHTITYEGIETVQYRNRVATVANVRLDGGDVYRPALSRYPFATQAIGTPSVRTGPFEDVYLTLVASPGDPDGEAVIGVVVHPLVVWLWTGGGLMAIGTIMAAVPARGRGVRRRADPEGVVSSDEEHHEEPALAGRS
jgi:cytochrome c-type biogenesis protein CcmF